MMAELAKTDDATAGQPQACGVRAGTAPLPVVRQPPTGWARVRRAADSFGDLFYIQFAAIRTGWHWFFLMSSVIPLGLLMFLKFVAATANTSQASGARRAAAVSRDREATGARAAGGASPHRGGT
jgi:hypothetical protein